MNDNQKEIFWLILVISAIMTIFGLTSLGFIPITEHRFLDMLVVPAIIGSMIGSSSNRSYIPALAIGIVWSFVVVLAIHLNIAAPSIGLNNYSIFIPRIAVTFIAAASYNICRILQPGCSQNVYRGLISGIFTFIIVGVIVRTYTGYYNSNDILLNMHFFIDLIKQVLLPYTIISLIILRVWIGKLRQAHLLNGINNYPQDVDNIEKIYKCINKIFKTNFVRPLKPEQWKH